MHSGNAAAMPPARNEATFSFCHASRSVRITTAILVSNCMDDSAREGGIALKPSFDSPATEVRRTISRRSLLNVPYWAPNGHADRVVRCPLLERHRKTCALSECFAL